VSVREVQVAESVCRVVVCRVCWSCLSVVRARRAGAGRPPPSRTVLELSCVFARECIVSVGHTW
jgi:hypothetical protein